jgi:hypothetical protein
VEVQDMSMEHQGMGKFRQGWVSNSSSSSFIISAQEDTTLKVMVEMDLSKCIDKTLKTKEDVEKYIISQHGWSNKPLKEVLEEDYVREQYDGMVGAVKSGDIVYVLSGSSDDYDNAPGTYLYNNGLKGLQNINIIEDGD